MEIGKTYFLMGMADEDYYVLLTLCRNTRVSKEQFIMDALKTHIEKLQQEWRELQKVQPKPSGASGSAPQPERGPENSEPKPNPKKGEKESEET